MNAAENSTLVRLSRGELAPAVERLGQPVRKISSLPNPHSG